MLMNSSILLNAKMVKEKTNLLADESIIPKPFYSSIKRDNNEEATNECETQPNHNPFHRSLPGYKDEKSNKSRKQCCQVNNQQLSSIKEQLFNSLCDCHCNQRNPINLLLVQNFLKPINENCPKNIVGPLSRKQWWIIFSLIYGNFWVAACVSLQAPFFPKEAEMKGASATQYGFVFGIYELMILLTAPLFGKMVTRYSPITISKYGLLICGASTIVFGFIDKAPSGLTFIILAYLIRIVEGISASAFMTASYTVMAAKFPTRVATTFAYLEAAFGVGMILGPTLGGALYELNGFAYPFVTLGTCLLAGCFVNHFLMSPNNGPQDLSDCSTAIHQDEGNMTQFISNRAIIFDVLSIVTSLNYLGFNAATLEPHLRQFNLSPFFTGLIFITTGLTYALSTPFWGALCERGMSPKLLIMIGSILCWIGIIFLGPLSFIPLKPSLPLIVISLCLTGFGISAKMVCAFMDAMNDSIKKRGFKNDVSTYGMVSAMFFTSCSIGAFIGPSIGGFLLDTFDYRRSTLLIFLVDLFLTIYSLFFVCSRETNLSSSHRSIKIGP
ncbi:hypothetical protein BLOT_001932 [Blomia tropicalis]|nr:hypothetical protein BLOT_001932 [Blomia tropicalis]